MESAEILVKMEIVPHTLNSVITNKNGSLMHLKTPSTVRGKSLLSINASYTSSLLLFICALQYDTFVLYFFHVRTLAIVEGSI